MKRIANVKRTKRVRTTLLAAELHQHSPGFLSLGEGARIGFAVISAIIGYTYTPRSATCEPTCSQLRDNRIFDTVTARWRRFLEDDGHVIVRNGADRCFIVGTRENKLCFIHQKTSQGKKLIGRADHIGQRIKAKQLSKQQRLDMATLHHVHAIVDNQLSSGIFAH